MGGVRSSSNESGLEIMVEMYIFEPQLHADIVCGTTSLNRIAHALLSAGKVTLGWSESTHDVGHLSAPSANCGDVNAVVDEHIGHVTGQVQELRVLGRQLRGLRSQCQSIESGAAGGIL